MNFETFERRAREEWERIPKAYRSGVDGLVIEREARPHPQSNDVYTLGECVTEGYPSAFGGPDTIRSFVVLYYGSFLRLSRIDETFDWDEEIWETLTHELKHHLESLADEDALIDLDYAVDENFKRHEGSDFDPFFFRSGEPMGGGQYRLERNVFVEREAPAEGGLIEFSVGEATYRVAVPPVAADVTFLSLTGDVDQDMDELCLVLIRKPGVRGALRSLLSRQGPEVVEIEVPVERLHG